MRNPGILIIFALNLVFYWSDGFRATVGRYQQTPVPKQASLLLLGSDPKTLEVDETEVEGTARRNRAPQRFYNTFEWKDYDINYRVEGPSDGIPVLLIHGFGASVGHFRKNIPVLAEAGYRVYAIDLLGFGGSSKPKEVEVFCMELWQDIVIDFIKAMSSSPEEQWIVCGNSIGGLLSIMVTSTLQNKVKGTILFNSAGGMTSFRDEELPWILKPVLWFFRNVIFSDTYGPGTFQRFKTEQNVRQILNQVYGNKNAVDDELVDMLLAPSDDDGACEVFLKVFRGPAGPSPEALLPTVATPVLALWGEDDPWTPLCYGLHPGMKFPEYCDTLKLIPLPGCGHCPHDDRPDLVNQHMLDFLSTL